MKHLSHIYALMQFLAEIVSPLYPQPLAIYLDSRLLPVLNYLINLCHLSFFQAFLCPSFIAEI